MKFVRDTMTTFLAQIGAVLLGIAASIVVARVLGPSGKGAYSLIILVPTLLVLAANMGIGVSNAYFGGKGKYSFAQLASNSIISALGLGLLSSSAFLACYFILRSSFPSEVDPVHLVLATTMVPFSLLTNYSAYIVLAQGRIRQYNLLQVMPGFVSLALILILLLAFNGGVLGTIVAWVGGVLTGAIVSILLVLRVTETHLSFEARVFRDSVKFGVQGYLGNVIQFLNYRVDMVMVAYLMSVSDVGYYSVAVAIAEALWYFPGAVGTMVFARTPGLSDEEANRTTPRICRTTFFVTIVAALALFGLGRYLIFLLFGSGFGPSLKPLWYLLPGVVALSVCKVLSNELAGRGKPMINAAAAGVSLAVNVPLNFFLIPKMGIAGAAVASSVSYSLSAVVTLAAFARITGISWFDTVVVKPEDFRLWMSAVRGISTRSQAVADIWRSR